MVGTISIGCERASEVRRREGGDLVGHSQLDRGVVKGCHGFADLGQQTWMLRDQVVVQIKAA